MKNFLTSLWWFFNVRQANQWTKEEVHRILSQWFDINHIWSIHEKQLKEILQYHFIDGTPSFFVIGWSNKTSKDKFKGKHIDMCYESDWYTMIRPNDSSHIIFPKLEISIQYDSRNQQGLITKDDWKKWWHWWWSFQLDKNDWKVLLYSPLNAIDTIAIFEKQNNLKIPKL